MKECINCHITISDEDVKKYNNVCPCCHSRDSFIEEYIMDIKRISTDDEFVKAMIRLHDEDIVEYQIKLNELRLQKEQADKIFEQELEDARPRCPHCHSKNIKSLSALDRGASIAMLGIFSKKINKSFECKSCGYTW